MTARELLEIIANGENSAVEFKREAVRPEHLAEEIVAFANLEGGTIFIGVADDGFIEARLFQLSGMVHYDITPVPGTAEKDLDPDKLRNYFLEFNYFDLLEEPPEQRRRILVNADILARTKEQLWVTVGGLLIFGKEPARHLPQSGITYARFRGTDLTTEILDKKEINGTLPEVVERCATIIRDTVAVPAQIQEMKRREKDVLPAVVIREALVNAVVHRNYSIAGAKIRVFRFADRIEVRSPGRLPNTVTVEKMKIGTSFARNPFLLKYMENLRYVDRLGRGIPMIIRQMKNLVGKEPGLEEKGEEFWLTLYLQ